MNTLLSEIGIESVVTLSAEAQLPLLPAAWDPLAHTSLLPLIAPSARIRFNRLFACAFHEQIAFLEKTLSEELLLPLLADPEFVSEHAAFQVFHDQELRHCRAFHAWNRHMEPALYAGRPEGPLFVQASPMQQRVLGAMARRVRQWPWLLWLIILQEERALNVARSLAVIDCPLDPDMRALHRWHLRDEEEHLACDARLIEQIWAPAPAWRRRLNAAIVFHLIREFYCAPKRAGLRVLDAWLAECPEYRHLRSRVQREFSGLGTQARFLRHNYGPDMIGQTLEMMTAWPEFEPMRRWVDSFSREST